MKLSVASSAELCLLFLLGIGRTSAQDALPTHTVQKGQKLRKLEVISSKNGKLTTELAIAPMRIDVPSAGLSFTTRAYNSKFPASTIRVNPGDDVEVCRVEGLFKQGKVSEREMN